MAKYKPWLTACCVLLIVICAVALVSLCIATLLGAGCSGGRFRHAAVSADSQLCSEIGKNMLLQGGSAVDGAIAALLCTSLVNPQSMGIGGGSIVVVRNKTGNVKVYNFRESTPQTFKPSLLKDCPTKFGLTAGSQWIGVPGELLGYDALHREYGKLSWAKLFEPTIKLAREGIPMPPYLARFMSHELLKPHVETSSLCEVFCNKNKTILRMGDTMQFSKLAETLEIIAKEGVKAFYTGRIGLDLIQDIKDAGGTLTVDDLKSYRVRVGSPWTVSLGNHKMHIAPPPAGGALLAFILRIMKGFSLTPDSLVGEKKKIQMYHRYIEAAKFANGQKRNIRDPVYSSSKMADHLIDPSFIDRIARLISSNRTHDNSYYRNHKPLLDNFGTTHVSVMDADGLAVSATSTINQLFGGAVYSKRTGIILNNELVDFCGRVDSIQGGEQPPSSMSPVILEKESGGILVMGGSGGSLITTSMALSLINRLWLGMSLKDSIAAPIIFVNSNNDVNFEPEFDKSVINGLRRLGHKTGNWPFFLNVVNALEKENGCIAAVSDSRKLGMSAGY
ncbi:glutathione hydrolase 5 proenzyme isoform X2 [Xiphophorus hellerii]|uniref:glutathione hydrolase 5 proenzyme isoform X1 n=1 Tax=Xiphophorus hellerii TaxID=8084 RepID=UPI0013B417E2|nr:glutathione hydrolase 5 proenzyme-like isoform X1 [Xiphophorus hellerii]XP_032425493.1 glutathione hydrolase 5 proenzyme-like isoform X2 [Xiphophorus hellerii]